MWDWTGQSMWDSTLAFELAILALFLPLAEF